MIFNNNIVIFKNWYLERRSNARLQARTVVCDTCASAVKIPRLNLGQAASCPRCKVTLAAIDHDPFAAPIALAAAALIVLIVVAGCLFIEITIGGASYSINLSQMMEFLFAQDFGNLACFLFVLVFATPVLFLILTIYVYVALIRKSQFPLLVESINCLLALRSWVMVDIFFVSALVALIKIKEVSTVSYGIAFFALFAYSLILLRLTLAIPRHWVYYQLAHIKLKEYYALATKITNNNCRRCSYYQPINQLVCTICNNKLHHREPNSLQYSWAFLLTAMVFYIPANFLPIMISSNPMYINTNQILDGIVYMWQRGEYFVAAIIFTASIAVPIIKIIVMLILLLSVQFKLFFKPIILTKLYILIEKIGRWSMLDVFVIMILMSVFRSNMARVVPGEAAIYFTLVVVFTMLSTYFFDIRLIWDKTNNKANNI